MKLSPFVKFLKFSVALFFLLQVFVSCTRQKMQDVTSQKTPEAQSRFLLNTICNINLYDDGTQELYASLFDVIADIEKKFSSHIESSYISRINNAAGSHAVEVPADVLYVIQAAVEYSALTYGAFDPTVGPLVSLWGINTDFERVPAQTEIDEVLPLIDWRDIEITENNTVASLSHAEKEAATTLAESPSQAENAGTVFLRRKNMALDLGGIAKGYAADEVVKILREKNVKRCIIDLGGNIYVFGKKTDGSPWRVGVKNPIAPEGSPALVLSLENSTVVTSGVYERFFIEDGVRYHHILDTRTGKPASSGLLSATIVCDSSMMADALSTSLFLLGQERGLQLLRQLGVSGICITEDGNITASRELQSALQVASGYSGKLEFK